MSYSLVEIADRLGAVPGEDLCKKIGGLGLTNLKEIFGPEKAAAIFEHYCSWWDAGCPTDAELRS